MHLKFNLPVTAHCTRGAAFRPRDHRYSIKLILHNLHRTLRLLRRRRRTRLLKLKAHLFMRSRYYSLGARGERAARRFLERSRYLIWEMNHRSKLGEIDIIASIGRTLVFVEVKTRTVHSQAFPTERSIDRIKQERLQRAAQHFVHQQVGLLRRRRTLRTQFDVIMLERTGRWVRPFNIVHLPGAVDWKRGLFASNNSARRGAIGA